MAAIAGPQLASAASTGSMSAGSGATNSSGCPRSDGEQQSPGMQRLAIQQHLRVGRIAADLAARDRGPAAVQPVAQHRAADAGQVQANLMRAARLRQHAEGWRSRSNRSTTS